jgi:predicted branched-subunit amino acid permease
VSAFLAGLRAASSTVFTLVVSGTYIGIGALAHDFGFSLVWSLLCTLLVWAGPAQVILISSLGGGATVLAAGIAVCISSVRLLPMVVALLPMLKRPGMSAWRLVVPAHFTAVSMWVEALRLLPGQPREDRIAFCNGLGTGYLLTAMAATVTGFYLAAKLPPLASGALLFLTPLAFLMSTLRNSRMLVDYLALGFGLLLGPAFALTGSEFDLMWSGLVAGTAAYIIHRFREAMA